MIGPYQLREFDKLVSRLFFHNTTEPIPYFTTNVQATKFLRDSFPEDASWFGPIEAPNNMWKFKIYFMDDSVEIIDETPMLTVCHGALWIVKKISDEIRKKEKEASDVLLHNASLDSLVQN